jgi:ABC-type branched-subunit amino acid transport system ATPase component
MSTKLLCLCEIKKDFGGIKALNNFSCSLQKGEILGLIGPNGAGKTSLFNIISGFIAPDSGKIILKGKNVTGTPPHKMANLGISRTFQNLRIIRHISVLDNILLSFREQPGERLTNIFLNWRKSLAREATNYIQAKALLQETGLAHRANALAEDLSYGQQKLLSLICCLVTKSEVLLLDEPVAGIAPEMIDKILEVILSLPSGDKSLIIIEHNMNAVMRVCDRIVFMNAGAIVSEGSPDMVLNDPKVIEAYIH